MSSPHYPDQSAGPCSICGRALDACGTCVCVGWDMGSENRRGAVNGPATHAWPTLPEEGPANHCINAEAGIQSGRRFSEPTSCPDCDGRGWVETHICRDEKECARLGPSCPRREACFGCLGSGVKHGA